MAALSQRRCDGIPLVSLPGPRGPGLSSPIPVTWQDGGGGGSSPGMAAWTQSGPRVTRRGEGPTSLPVLGGGSSIGPSGPACRRDQHTGLSSGGPDGHTDASVPSAGSSKGKSASPALLLQPPPLTPQTRASSLTDRTLLYAVFHQPGEPSVR